MKNIEDVLKACQKPDVRVPVFRELLRQEIQQRILVSSTVPKYVPIGFVLMGALVFLFAALLTLFILRPEVPQRVHAWLGYEKKAQRTFEQVFVPPSVNPTMDRLTPVHQALLSGDRDRAYAQQWVNRNYPKVTSKVFDIENERIVTLRQIRLDDGRKVMVMTEFNPQENLEKLLINNRTNGGIL